VLTAANSSYQFMQTYFEKILTMELGQHVIIVVLSLWS